MIFLSHFRSSVYNRNQFTNILPVRYIIFFFFFVFIVVNTEERTNRRNENEIVQTHLGEEGKMKYKQSQLGKSLSKSMWLLQLRIVLPTCVRDPES